MAQTAIDFYFIGLLVERGGIREGMRDVTADKFVHIGVCVCVCVCKCLKACCAFLLMAVSLRLFLF